MSIGGSRSEFWHLTPKDILIDFEAHKNKINEKIQMAWVIGAYTKAALASQVLACGLADRKAINQMPKYPSRPNTQDDFDDEEEIEAKRKMMIAKMNYWTKMNNKNRQKK